MKHLYTLLLVGVLALQSYAQTPIDILHYDLSLTIQNVSAKTISGTAKLKLLSLQNNLSQLRLGLLKLDVSAVSGNSIPLPFTQTDSTLLVNLNTPQQAGDTFELSISYGGQPVTDAQWGGFYFSGDYAYNMGVGFQSNPHNFGRCWFPCIDNFTDRATYTFHITTDTLFKGVCSGILLAETHNSDGSITWSWAMNQPIPTYLASVAVGKYEFMEYRFTGSSQTFPVLIAVVAADTAKARLSFNKLNDALSCFESKYGPYPFERVGYVGVPFNAGAMEHATNIAYPNYAINGGTDYETLFAHELAHMWWGNLATCRTAEDMWLNEGWASFNEALFLECVYGKQAYINDIQTKSAQVLLNAPQDDGAWYPVSGVPHQATYGTHVYKKGALMVHTLRSLMGDSAFFAATRNYMQTHRFTDVSTADLMNSFQPFTPHNLNAFFQKWIYSPGHSDIVLSAYSNTGGQWRFSFKELNRINQLITPTLPFTFTAHLSNGSRFTRTLLLTNDEAQFDTILLPTITLTSYAINLNNEVQLASLTQKQSLTQTGNVVLGNVLLTINTQTSGNPGDSLIVTHHWVGPIDVNLKAQGIRISTERYWTVQQNTNTSAVVSAFLNYNGNSMFFLDTDLITTTEDSLVLLYRANVNQNWEVHTDHTFQPGPNKTDKTGRFWVNLLKAGDYAFGYKNYSVVGLNDINPKQPKAAFTLVPNPADTEHRVLLIWEKSTFVNTITVTNTQGQTIKQVGVNKQLSRFELDTQGLPLGLYTVTVFANGTHTTQKLIIP